MTKPPWRVRSGDVEYEELKAQLRYLIKKYNRICQRCFTKIPKGQATREHIKRLIDGGTSELSNLTLMCVKCNVKMNKIATREATPLRYINECIARQATGLPVVAIATARTRHNRVADTWPILITKGIHGTIRRQQIGAMLVGPPPAGVLFTYIGPRRT